jgi:hypothetical protein
MCSSIGIQCAKMAWNMFKRFITFFVIAACAGILLRGFAIHQFRSSSGITVEVRDIAESLGIVHRHEQLRYEDFKGNSVERKTYRYIASQGANVAVVDVNDDGAYDIFFPSTLYRGRSYLYLNLKDGSFREAAQEFGLDRINETGVTSRAIFFDADNDGSAELLQLSQLCPVLYKKDSAGIYRPKALELEQRLCQFSLGVNVLDLNQDGLLDIVFAPIAGALGEPNFYLPRNFVENETGGRTAVLMNQGNLEFAVDRELLSRYQRTLFTNAIGVGDFLGLGMQDLWFATDYNNDQVYFARDGYRKATNLKGSLAKSGMAVEQVYLGKKSYVFISHVHQNFFYPYGNNFWSFEEGEFVDYAEKFDVQNCGFAWGAKFVDANSDGYLDLYVANGLFGDSRAQKEYWYNLSLVASLYQPLMSEGKMWPSMDDYHLSGNNQDCLFLNQGNERFVRVEKTAPSQIDLEGFNGRGVASVDIANDGTQQLVVVNQLERPYVYEFKKPMDSVWIGFKLVGTKSNRDAIGAVVDLELEDGSFVSRQVSPFNGYASQSDPRLLFILPKGKSIKSVGVRWPTMRSQKITAFQMKTYNMVLEE